VRRRTLKRKEGQVGKKEMRKKRRMKTREGEVR
jgi:hypothetical protein